MSRANTCTEDLRLKRASSKSDERRERLNANYLTSEDITKIKLIRSQKPTASIPPRQSTVPYRPDAELVEVLSRSPRLSRHLRRSTLMLRAMISTVRADVTAEETYEWRPGGDWGGDWGGVPITRRQLSCPVSVFAGTHDEETSDLELTGWREVTSSTCTVHRLPGDHHYLDDARGREMLTKSIAATLGRHMTRHTSWLGVF